MKPSVSVIMPFYKDLDTVLATLDSLYATIGIDNFELIVINDGSGRGYDIPKSAIRPNMRVLSHFINIGVGQAFDTGVGIAKSDNLILMGSDLIFLDNDWARRMVNVTTKHPKAVVCASCGSTKSNTIYYGADIVFYIENKDLTENHPKKGTRNYRSILEGKWRPRTQRGVYQIPCLMGAFYGVKKKWYNYINGFELHSQWGNLEPLISLKSWRLGGEVLVDSENKALHVFNRLSTGEDSKRREAKYDIIKYNQLMIASTVFGLYGQKYSRHLEGEQGIAFNNACEAWNDKMDSITWLAKDSRERAEMTPEELEKKMVELSYVYNKKGCKYRNPLKQ